MSVNMFRFRVMTDRQPRWKKGHAPHRTTGVAKASSIRWRVPPLGRSPARPGSMAPIERTSSGALSARLTQKRRDISASSGFSSSSMDGVIGSSAIPQIGHEPGTSSITSGCMGQVHLPAAFARESAEAAGCEGPLPLSER